MREELSRGPRIQDHGTAAQRVSLLKVPTLGERIAQRSEVLRGDVQAPWTHGGFAPLDRSIGRHDSNQRTIEHTRDGKRRTLDAGYAANARERLAIRADELGGRRFRATIAKVHGRTEHSV